MKLLYELVKERDRMVIENKYHKVSENFDPFNRMDYHGYDYDETTGLSDEEIKKGLSALSEKLKNEPRQIIKARLFEYILDNTRIDVNDNDYFVGIYSWGRLIKDYTVNPWHNEILKKVNGRTEGFRDKMMAAGLSWIALDFDHSVPDWDSLIKLGFPGILKRLEKSCEKHRAENTLTEKREIFYNAASIEYKATLRLIKRLYYYSAAKKSDKAKTVSKALLNLAQGAPQNTFEVLLLIYIYFILSECVDYNQVRSLGYGLDATLMPFYEKDIENGTFTKEELASFIAYFLLQFHAMGNYWGQPLYLGGTNADGSTKVCELSYLILDIMDTLGIYNPKIQIKISEKTPKDFILKALGMIRGGSNGIVFCNEDIIVKALMMRGATFEEAMDSVVKGCYEYAVKAKSISTSFNTINALKPILLVFDNGRDISTGMDLGLKTGDVSSFESFGDFYRAYLKQLEYTIKRTMAVVNELEGHINEVNPVLLFAGTIPSCADNLADGNDGGMDTVSALLINGLGSAVDALMAVYELVFETGYTTMKVLKEAIASNWEGYEELRHKALSCRHKYGNGDKIADYYANAVHNLVASLIADAKNGLGGIYEYEIHSARAFIDMGKVTGATPDGRKEGEETSKNASPTPGMDKNGVTALINSVTTMDMSLANSGACLDVMLHPSAVAGDDGLLAFYSVLNTYIKKGGASIHFNVFDAKVLRDAQKNPQNYKNLQVRVCGWNVLWNNMCKEEQDAYIKRAENII